VSAIHKLVNSVLNKEELPEQWRGSIIVAVHMMDDKTDLLTNSVGLSTT
jgi:hypothetical protein